MREVADHPADAAVGEQAGDQVAEDRPAGAHRDPVIAAGRAGSRPSRSGTPRASGRDVPARTAVAPHSHDRRASALSVRLDVERLDPPRGYRLGGGPGEDAGERREAKAAAVEG